MAKALIKDGYNLTGTIDPIGPWPAVTIQYRPALPDRAQEFFDAANRGGKTRSDAVVKLLIDQLVSWDIEDDSGPAAISEATVRRVPFPVRERIVDMIAGYSGKADEKN